MSLRTVAERAANYVAGEAQQKAKADRRVKERRRQERRSQGEDSSDEEDDDETEAPPTVADEPALIDLTGEEAGVSLSRGEAGGTSNPPKPPTAEGADVHQRASGLFTGPTEEEEAIGGGAASLIWAPRGLEEVLTRRGAEGVRRPGLEAGTAGVSRLSPFIPSPVSDIHRALVIVSLFAGCPFCGRRPRRSSRSGLRLSSRWGPQHCSGRRRRRSPHRPWRIALRRD